MSRVPRAAYRDPRLRPRRRQRHGLAEERGRGRGRVRRVDDLAAFRGRLPHARERRSRSPGRVIAFRGRDDVYRPGEVELQRHDERERARALDARVPVREARRAGAFASRERREDGDEKQEPTRAERARHRRRFHISPAASARSRSVSLIESPARTIRAPRTTSRDWRARARLETGHRRSRAAALWADRRRARVCSLFWPR
eukprot:30957-Pelagococcus_subviridis.AAC.70